MDAVNARAGTWTARLPSGRLVRIVVERDHVVVHNESGAPLVRAATLAGVVADYGLTHLCEIRVEAPRSLAERSA